MYLTDKIEKLIQRAVVEYVRAAGISLSEIPTPDLDIPRIREHGDFATNIAMQLTSHMRRPPMEIAASIAERIPTEGTVIARAEVARPGFINIHVDPRELPFILRQILERKDTYGALNLGNNQRALVEFVSANPTGPLHLGHCRNAVVGDSLSRILAFAGYAVEREYYFNDAGAQMINLGKSLRARYLQQMGKDEPIPEDGYHGEYLIDIARQLVQERSDALVQTTELEPFISYATSFILEFIRKDLADLRISFDHYVSETEYHRRGKVDEVIEELRRRDMVYEHEGALWLKTTQFGDEKDRVLVKSNGEKTYLTPDIAYHRDKYLRGYDLLFNIFGGDHHGYIPRLKASMEALGFDSQRLHCLIIQMVTLKSGDDTVRFSKRAGGFITIREMIDEVGADVVRFFFLMRTMGSQLLFDWDLAKNTSMDNPVYYVQYGYARCCSLFKKAQEDNLDPAKVDSADLSLLQLPEEQAVLKELALFPDVVRRSALYYEPSFIVNYSRQLAAVFHNFFTAGTRNPALRIIIPGNIDLSYARLALVKGLQIVIRNAMSLISVSTPEEM